MDTNTIFGVERNRMPHMPLDTEIHWSWDNPLNLIPLGMLVLWAIGLLGLFV
jgi:hypothetical protein